MESKTESLLELAYRYFTRKGLNIDFNVEVDSQDGKKKKVDLVLTKPSGDQTGVLVVNWGRSIGVNVLRKLHSIVEGSPLKEAILVGETFSEHSRKFAKDYNVQLLSKSKIRYSMDEY